ncbi:TonB-dependent receptor [Duganella sp. Root198D2]|uniref:TonB-dependent receptor n=1 Tax=Duganella sp. Root198D2 TaxID=1736489 RepID=UPI00070CEC05|nr:TonB-dependent receptor [Duganella sp. Root198D2]KRC02898.1 TonB-dependent receptor [Duganella sp. Root198D2]
MMKENTLSYAIRLACASGLLAAGVCAPVFAQQTDAAIQRVEITGSSIKRIAQEGALPIQTLSRKDIDQTGVQNVADLVALLPSMQGMITSSASINGGGGGVQSASVHSIGTDYTLVLLNGKRMAPYGTGSAVNLASIPLAAVERVEILTDGASTLYGSDAIAGVVNFILKKNQNDLSIDATYNRPQEKGGQSSNFSLTKGFGNYDSDGFNVMLAYSHDQSKALSASQRDFSKSGVVKFSKDGKQYATWQNSINSIPANADVFNGPDVEATFSPDLVNTGKCNGPNTFARGGVCRYDYAATVELLPELKRDSLFTSGALKISDKTRLTGEFVYSKFTSTARYAAPAQPLTTMSTDPETHVKTISPVYIVPYKKSVEPLLAGQGIDPNAVTDAYLYYRARDAGGRTDDWGTKALHFSVGLDSEFAGWDVGAAYTHSQNKQTDKAAGGYMSGDKFEALVQSGAYNPYVFDPNSAAVLAPAVLHENLSTTKSKLDVVSAHASREVFAMAGGNAALGLGADYTMQKYEDSPSRILMGPGPGNPGWTDTVIGGGTGSQPLDAKRNNWGAFGELQMPVIKGLDVTASARYDSYDAVDKRNTSYDVNGNPSLAGKQGKDVSKATFKLSARWQPSKEVMLRGSYGTGFKAPTMNDISDPLKNAGSSNFFACPIKNAADPRFAYCRGVQEYGLLTVGNPATGGEALKPETSKQASIGMRLEPMDSLSLGVDFWDVRLKNQIQNLSQDMLFGTEALASKYATIYFDPIQKSKVLVMTQSPLNLASSRYRGIDMDATFRAATPIGKLTTNWSATYMLKAEKTVPDADHPGTNKTESSIARFDSYDDVTFRWISRLVFSLKSSEQWANSLTVNYKSGYADKDFTEDDGRVRSVNDDGTLGGYVDMKGRKVKAYTTLDWQSKYVFNQNFSITGGIRNLLDKDPPLSIRDTGGGNQVGYDGRYTDPLGRTFYLTASYKFK